MSLAFPRSMRSLKQDSSRVTLAALAAGVALLLLLAGWLVLTHIPVYETSRDWQVTRDGALLVKFSADALARLHPGQPAQLTLASAGDTPGRVMAATVREVANRNLNYLEPNTARLAVTGPLPKDGESGEVQVVVDQLSPWAVLTRALGQRLQR